ncbi:MAG TPA: histidine kinase [Puia sp.]|jgi:sensor histidine kinase YesM|nr:histidine kinase [Puia sp.]
MGMEKSWYKGRVLRVLTHAAVWAIALSLPYLLDSHRGIHHHDNDRHEQGFFYLNFITNLLWIGPFYLNVYLLTPKLFYKRRYVTYAAALALVFGIMLLIHACIFIYLFALPHFSFLGATGFMLPAFVLNSAIGTTFRVVRDKIQADRLAQEKQEENLKTELSFLRSQINPHFIFNILNNLVALEQMKSEELGPTILKLSSLLQYMLYDTDEEKVSLIKEVDYLQSYIDLQRQRFGTKVPVEVSMEVPPGYEEIEPMLLIPFVENAFKHGVGMIENPLIRITLRVSKGVLHFAVCNRYNPTSAEIKDKTSGIGLGNVMRRLKLLYGDQHVLHISRDDGWFVVSLELNLH